MSTTFTSAVLPAADPISRAGNTQLILLKSVNGDAGVALHKTDPDSISIDTTTTTFVLNAAGTVTGLLLIWS